MNNSTLEYIINETGARKSGDSYNGHCSNPSHDDKKPSLGIAQAADGTILIKCRAGCPTEAVISGLGLKLKDLFPQSNFNSQQRKEYKQKATKHSLWKSLYHELNVLFIIVDTRVTHEQLNKNKNYKNVRPEFKQIPDEFWERELLAVKRIKKIIGDLYGV